MRSESRVRCNRIIISDATDRYVQRRQRTDGNRLVENDVRVFRFLTNTVRSIYYYKYFCTIGTLNREDY